MNEEIKVTFGGDLTPLGTAMRSAGPMVKQFGESIKSSFTSAVGSIGSLISGGAIIGGIKSVIGHFEELNDKAQNLGISTDFLQGMEHIASKDAVGGVETFSKGISELSVRLGDAKTGGEEAIKKFEKWGITLKDIADLDTEGMFYKIADRIKSIPDPSERSAAAFELLGKAGKNLVGILGNGADEMKRMVDHVDKLDADKIKQLAEAKGTIQDVSNSATILAGKVLGGIGDAASWLGRASTGNFTADYTPPTAKASSGPAPDQTALKAQADALMEAKEKYLIAVGKSGNEESQLLAMYRERRDLQGKISGMQGDSVEKYKLMIELAGKDKEINGQIAKMKKEADDKRAKADEEHKKKVEEEKTLNKEIHETRKKISELQSERKKAETSEYMPTLEELANSGSWSGRGRRATFNEGPFASMARELLGLQQQAKEDLIYGDKSGFKQDTKRIDELKAALAKAGVMTTDDRLKSIDDNAKEQKDHLAELVQKAKTDGIKVIGPE